MKEAKNFSWNLEQVLNVTESQVMTRVANLSRQMMTMTYAATLAKDSRHTESVIIIIIYFALQPVINEGAHYGC